MRTQHRRMTSVIETQSPTLIKSILQRSLLRCWDSDEPSSKQHGWAKAMATRSLWLFLSGKVELAVANPINFIF
jgi:hypothetical protein